MSRVGAGLDLGWTMGWTIKILNGLSVNTIPHIGLDYRKKHAKFL